MPDLPPIDPAAEPALELRVDPNPDASSEALVRGVTHRRFLGEYDDAERAAAAGRVWAERVLPRARLLQVRSLVDNHQRGHVWLVEEGDDLGVLAMTLDDHRLAPAVRELVLDLARIEGFRRLTVGVAPGDPALTGFVYGRHFEVAAVQMRLDLDHALPDEALMRTGALWSRARGAHALGLNVFGYNHGAKSLYDRLGYHVVEEFAAHTIETRP